MRSPTRSTSSSGTSARPWTLSSGAKPQTIGLAGLAAAIRKGEVKTLVILGGNPVYNAPADLDWAALQKSVPQVVRFGYYDDETSELARTHIAAAHYLESWGDARTADGTVVPVQPMILPLFGGLTQIEVLATIVGLPEHGPVQAGLRHDHGRGRACRRGQIPQVPARRRPRELDAEAHQGALQPGAAGSDLPRRRRCRPPEVSSTPIEVRFVADARMDDGRFINNGWLQECPDPITKISWDNAILISPRLAKELGIDSPADGLKQVARKDLAEFDKGRENAHIVELTVGGRKITGPAHIQPGLANYTVIVPLGYGRTQDGPGGGGHGL